MKQDWVEELMRVLRIVMSNRGGERAIIRPWVDVARQAAGWTNPISKDLNVATLKEDWGVHDCLPAGERHRRGACPRSHNSERSDHSRKDRDNSVRR